MSDSFLYSCMGSDSESLPWSIHERFSLKCGVREETDDISDYEIFYEVDFSWILAYLSEIYLSNWPNIEKS